MEHLQAETLALRALGEPADSPREDDHLQQCQNCRKELEELRTVVVTARDIPADERSLPEPPSDLWDRIADELGDELAGADIDAGGSDPDVEGSQRDRTQAGPGGPAAPIRLPRPDSESSPEAGRLSGASGDVTSLDARRASRWPRTWSTIAAAAAIVLLLVVAVPSLLRGGEIAEPVGIAALDPLDDRASGARAELVEIDGEFVLRFDGDSLPDDVDGYFEVWLIDTDVAGMVSLGPLDLERGQPVPNGLDPSDFPIVDVSLEPIDGDPTHSGDSLLRGVLELEA